MCDGTKEALDVITHTRLLSGVTSVCPATMTIQRDELLSVMKNAGDYNYHGMCTSCRYQYGGTFYQSF